MQAGYQLHVSSRRQKGPGSCRNRTFSFEALCQMRPSLYGTDDKVSDQAGASHGDRSVHRRYENRISRKPIYLCMAKSCEQASGKISAENSASGWRYHPKARTEAIMAKTGQEETCEENLKEAKANEESLEFVSGRGHIKTQLQRDIEALEAALEKLKEYEKKLHICADRGSYAKTDPDATFMHMKDDHMLNGQLKPAYNIQHAVNSGFIVAAGIFPNPTDVMTLKPFLNQMEDDLSFAFERIVCDAGYESEENLSFLRTKRIEAYIKPANYEQIGTKKFAKEIGRKENMQYDKEKDCYRCHNGKEIKRIGSRKVKTASGYIREETQYACSECGGCPYKEKCMSGKNWKKPLAERYKKLTVSRLFEELREEEYRKIHSEEGKKLRMNRSIQAEGGFADIKGDSGFTRFLCKGTENVFAEYILYAMAHNLGWLHSRIQNDKLDLHLYELKEGEKEAA